MLKMMARATGEQDQSGSDGKYDGSAADQQIRDGPRSAVIHRS